MKTLVTGATGFLGGAITHALVREGQEVRILARKTSHLHSLSKLPVDIRHGSLEDKSSLVDLFRDIEFVYHCAALVSDWGSWTEFYEANVRGVQNLLEAAQQEGTLRRFVRISTTDVYGYPVEPVAETHPIIDVGLPYNRSKGLGEKAVWDIYQRTGMPVTVIRPATIYGPRSMSIKVEIAALLSQKRMGLFSGGRLPAGLLYIDSAVEGILQAGRSPQTVGQAYNLRDEGNESWFQFVSALATGLELGLPSIRIPSQLAMIIANSYEIVYRWLGIQGRPLLTRHAAYILCRNQDYPIKKAQQDFGFRSKVSFEEGMERTLTWLASEEGREALSKKLK